MRRTLRLRYAWQVRTRATALVAASAAVLVAVAVTVVALAANADEFGPPELKRALALRVTQVLEQATLQEHREHGHHFGEHDGQVVCAVAPFGVHPEGAVKVAEVRWVYAHHMCAVTGARQSWATSVRAAGPIAVRLAGRPTVRVPASGGDYAEQVRALVPERCHEAALAGFADDEAIEEARRRFDGRRG
ncbi:hypothetical protein [Nonomuraea dietziae]|uniref:hypothetical protein n=1 Tax=Nonomuraea dietziae TaxID=65515 RepID=UPI003414CB26